LLGAIGLALAMAGGDQKAASKGKPRDLPSFLDEFKSAGKAKPLPLFLDDFLADREVRLIQKEVRFPSPVGAVKGFWVRPLQLSKLPAVLMIHDQDQWTDWMKLNARHLASIGYEVLLVNLHQIGRAHV
jgi:dipeptidyl aminopeptidase/acylaminoacyl peptidase